MRKHRYTKDKYIKNKKKGKNKNTKKIRGGSIESLNQEINNLEIDIDNALKICENCDADTPEMAKKLSDITNKRIFNESKNKALNFLRINLENLQNISYQMWLNQYSEGEEEDPRIFRSDAPMLNVNVWNNALYDKIRELDKLTPKDNNDLIDINQKINSLKNLLKNVSNYPIDIHYILNDNFLENSSKQLTAGTKKNKYKKKIKDKKIKKTLKQNGGFFGVFKKVFKKIFKRTKKKQAEKKCNCSPEDLLDNHEKIMQLKKQLRKKKECKTQYDNSEEMSFDDKEKKLLECLKEQN